MTLWKNKVKLHVVLSLKMSSFTSHSIFTKRENFYINRQAILVHGGMILQTFYYSL